MSINCRSLVSHPEKLEALKVLVSVNSYSIVTLTETWLDDSIDDEDISIDGYSLLREDRHNRLSRSGGVAVYM